MYSENNRRAATDRANAEFLRRMLGGELSTDTAPVMNMTSVEKPQTPQPAPMPTQRRNERVYCDGTPRPDQSATACPKTLSAPSLAMVYAPKQCWSNLLSPAEGLAKGSIFADLILPLEAVKPKCEKEVRACFHN